MVWTPPNCGGGSTCGLDRPIGDFGSRMPIVAAHKDTGVFFAA
jgi:hypothetical protein